LNNAQGGSWHGKDMELIFWMGRHTIVVTLTGFVIGFTVAGLVWWILRRVARFWGRERWREKTVGYRSDSDDV
jgi:mannosyltransferase OCH1-like enzyme